MPMELRVHAEYCAYRTGGPCGCTPLVTTDHEVARAAHQGDTERLQVVMVTPPPIDWANRPPVPHYRSQAARHLRPISD